MNPEYEELDDPRQWDDLTTMVCFHKRYNLGDETDYQSDDYDCWNHMQADIICNEDTVIILPLFMYDHSGLFISTEVEPYWWHYAWDGGQIGFVYVTREKAMEVFDWQRITNKRRKFLTEQIQQAVENYDYYLRN